MRRVVGSIGLFVVGLGVLAARAVDVDYGRSAVGFRTALLAAHDGVPAGEIQLWYPAASATCPTPLTYGDYLRADAREPGQEVAAQLRQAWSFAAPPLDDAQWARVTAAPMRGCRDTPAAASAAPLIVAIHLPGAWPVAAEFFASHGYAFAVVSRPGAPPAGADLVDRIAQRQREFVRDLRDAIGRLRASTEIDASRVGAIGQSHALLMLAMSEPSVRAVALQDSAFATGRDADADAKTGLWEPAQFRAALLHATTEDRLAADTAWEAFRRAAPGQVTRQVFAPAHVGHNDVTADGYLTRRFAPIETPPHDALARAFEALLAAQKAFFDRNLLRASRPPSP
ncbi:MAG TPA: hypothetical protein VFV98_19975 [Vicinamibacterales bacterium]|nr:hypothetical protein [Vicinamibacterales bacterium]